MPGYSGTPLAKKLGIKPGCRVCVEGAPANYKGLLAPLPPDVTFVELADDEPDLIHFFTKSASELAEKLAEFVDCIQDDAVIWVSWPKKASKVKTDITEDTIREHAFPLGLVDVKVCAVDDVWSGLKLVLRLVNRQKKKK